MSDTTPTWDELSHYAKLTLLVFYAAKKADCGGWDGGIPIVTAEHIAKNLLSLFWTDDDVELFRARLVADTGEYCRRVICEETA